MKSSPRISDSVETCSWEHGDDGMHGVSVYMEVLVEMVILAILALVMDFHDIGVVNMHVSA